MKRLRELWDRWRREPELRAAQTLLEERSANEKRLVQRATDIAIQLTRAQEGIRLYSELVHGGRLKARCSRGCGAHTFEWRPVVEGIDGRQVLMPVCEECVRREKREAKAAETAPPGKPMARTDTTEEEEEKNLTRAVTLGNER